ncbi:hypothetical protein M8J76_003396 [Diaphorina citri]|nr:hypothetical protein M8J76_003396 [Diaphorina citri]KAI5718135.1 hypothetical protein M8J77_016821 [Diaphorina citri]
MSAELMKEISGKSHHPDLMDWNLLDKEDEGKELLSDETLSPIQEFYKDQTIFITGATGFLGSLLVEKLLRCCPQIRKIILLIRTRGSTGITHRVYNYFNDAVFDRMRLECPNYADKVDIVCGQLEADTFGLSARDEELLISQTTIIFHIAATVRFDEHIRTAYNINVKGTQTILALAKRMKGLKSFVHVSTAYCNCDRKFIAEKFYPPVFTAEELSALVAHASDEEIALLNEHIIGGKPNSYTLTKATAEDLVRQVGHELPICVLRPSIVFPTLQEPMPLWIKGFNGVMALALGAGTGLIRVVQTDPNISMDVVPGDRVINAMAALAWYQTLPRPKKEESAIFNYVSYNDNRFKVMKFITTCEEKPTEVSESCDSVVWKHHTYYIANTTVYNILFKILHFIPALVFSLAERLTHQKPRIIKFYRKFSFLSNTISFFATNEWCFANENTRAMVRAISKEDQARFDSSFNFQWETFCEVMHRCISFYMLGERMTKEHYQRRTIYIAWIDDFIWLSVKAIALYFFLDFLAHRINSFILV